ncbi:hypothetical protein [Mesobacillus maritimus]|uniref:glycoside hydrolase family 16 protein n=1 Tax=Mesobacillus maritimus TaxID=1643336 RepID=UPI00384C53F3
MESKNQEKLSKEMMTLSNTEAEWKLVWEENFNLSEIDENKWNFVEAGTGFGNEESQYYTRRKENARIENGMLVLEARNEEYNGMGYTSAKLTTRGKAA